MSTKIWTAYVMRDKRQLWPVCRKIRLKCEAEVRKILVEQYTYNIEHAKDTLGKDDDPYKKYRYTDSGEITPWCASNYIHSQFGETLTKPYRDAFDLSVSVAIRQAQDGRILMIPYSGSGLFRGSLEFMRKMPELRDYHYQNQSDQPKHISSRAWAERRRTWDPLLADKEWKHMLVLEIVSYNGWFEICPALEMSRKKAGSK